MGTDLDIKKQPSPPASGRFVATIGVVVLSIPGILSIAWLYILGVRVTNSGVFTAQDAASLIIDLTSVCTVLLIGLGIAIYLLARRPR